MTSRKNNNHLLDGRASVESAQWRRPAGNTFARGSNTQDQRHSLLKQDAVIAGIATLIGFAVLDRQEAWQNAVGAIVIGLGAGLVYQTLKVIGRFIWTVPREADAQLDVALERLAPKFGIAAWDIVRTPDTDRDTGCLVGKSIYVQLIARCLTERRVEELQPFLLAIDHKYPLPEFGWQKTEVNESQALGWSLNSNAFAPITLLPGVPARFNVFHISDQRPRLLWPAVNGVPNRAFNVIDRQGSFRFIVVVTAKEGPSVEVIVECEKTNEWDKPIIRATQSGVSIPRCENQPTETN